ncbi:hypothetical protein F5879DRAFT_550437 [Lentinula edodes]|nr:hypothetical protein F5879DRAFT_550437 [Lentinula edodes]
MLFFNLWAALSASSTIVALQFRHRNTHSSRKKAALQFDAHMETLQMCGLLTLIASVSTEEWYLYSVLATKNSVAIMVCLNNSCILKHN